MKTANKIVVNGTTYQIVDDYGHVYVVLSERQNGERSFYVRTTTGKYGKDPLLGNEPLGDVFPMCRLFGIPFMWINCVYSHRQHSRWKHFLGVMHHEYTSQQARKMAQRAAMEYEVSTDSK